MMTKNFQNKPYKALGLTIIGLLIVLYGGLLSVDAYFPASSNLTAYFNFDTGNATHIPNLINITNNFTLVNMEAGDKTVGKLNNSYLFGGGDEYGYTNFGLFPDMTEELSVNVWFNVSDSSLPRYIFDLAFFAPFAADNLGCNVMNNTHLRCRFDTPTVLYEPFVRYDNTSWQMLTFTWKRNDNISIYINGSLAYTNLTTGYLHNSSHMRIGSSKINLNHFIGNIDEFGIWRQKLTAAQVLQIYNNSNGFVYNVSTPFIENQLTYNPITTSNSIETFALNLTYDNLTYTGTNVYLTYNNTNYTTTSSGTGDNKIFTSSITIPYVTSTINKSFYFDIGLSNATGIYYFHSTTYNQTITNLSIDNCTTGATQMFNFSLFDEDDSSFINGVTQNSTIEVDFTISTLTGVPYFTYSNSFNQTNPVTLCLSNNLSSLQYRLDGVIRYSTTGRFTEYYNFQNYTLKNSTINITIPLYDLLESSGQEFKIIYKDQNFLPVTGAIIEIQRKYISEGVYKTVERPKTNLEGYIIGHLIINDALYNLLVYKDGVLLATFEDITADCQNPALTTCVININEYGSFSVPSDFTDYNDFIFSINYDESTRVISSLFSIPSGIPSTISMNVTAFDMLGNTSVCSHSLFTSGGTLSCTVPVSFGNSTVIVNLYKDGTLTGYSVLRLKQEPTDVYGKNIIFIALILFLIFVGIGASSDSPMIMGLFLMIGVIMLVSLNLIYTPSLFGAGATVLWFIICIVLILIKGSNRT